MNKSMYIQGKPEIKNQHYDVSIILLIYEQSKEKILLTLMSIIKQDGISKQIIISDDGSEVTYIKDCIEFMKNYAFYDYKVLYHENNLGTVKNYYEAVKVADGDFIKGLGPGDCFTSSRALFLWINDIKRRKAKLSFCDAIYYYEADNKFKCRVEKAHPQIPHIYNKNIFLQKKSYLLFEDIFLGAVILSEKKITCEYLCLISDKCKYAEDNMYRLMALNGVKFSYYPENAIYYEHGSGISTQDGDTIFKKQIKSDWEEVSKYIYNNCGKGYIERLIKRYYELRYYKEIKKENTILDVIFEKLVYVEFFLHKKNKKGIRYTANSDLYYLYQLKEIVKDSKAV